MNNLKVFFHACLIDSWFIIFVNFLIILPISFKFFIIPRIERRVGEKIKYFMSIYRWQIFSSWFGPPTEVGYVIFIQYLIWKIKKRLPGKAWGYNENTNFALLRIHYDIGKASRLEIVMSFWVMINQFWFVFMGIVAWLFPHWI